MYSEEQKSSRVFIYGFWKSLWRTVSSRNCRMELTNKLHILDVKTIALSDTIGVSNQENISPLFSTLISEYLDIEFEAHFHTTPDKWKEKVDSSFSKWM